MKPAARLQTAIDLLCEVEASPQPAERVITPYLRARRFIGSKDRRDITSRVYGVIRARRRLAWWLAEAGLAEEARGLVFAHALLCEGLTLDELAAGCDGGPHVPAPLGDAEAEALATLAGQALDHPDMDGATRGEVPDWLHARMVAQYGAAGAAAELSALGEEASLDLRVNSLKASREAAMASLRADGLEAEPTAWSPWGLRIKGRAALGNCRAYRDGLVEVQDEGSQLIALLCDARPGMAVADLCAGAGGKTLALAATMGDQGTLLAADVDGRRLERARPRIEKADVTIARFRSLNEKTWKELAEPGFDRVLVDAPCSGSGTWRRQPDGRLRLSEARLAELGAMQADVLTRAADTVKPGGRLIYATCSLLREENQQQIEAFLAKRPDYRLRDATALWAEVADSPCPFAGEVMALSPAQQGLDGFFCAVLDRVAAAV